MTNKSGFAQSHTPHTKEFSRRAQSYGKYNIIQKAVAEKLITSIKTRPEKILDLGCGSGAVYNLIDWEVTSFTGLDKAEQMCRLHPEAEHIRLIHADFEDHTLLQRLGRFDMVISSSAIQWAKNPDSLFSTVSDITEEIAFAIFTEGTFQTIYDLTGMQTFLPDKEKLVRMMQRYFTIEWEVANYRLDFPDNISKFRYIKQSGVSGGRRKLTVRETRALIRDYPHTYLEFEVLFAWGRVRK